MNTRNIYYIISTATSSTMSVVKVYCVTQEKSPFCHIPRNIHNFYKGLTTRKASSNALLGAKNREKKN